MPVYAAGRPGHVPAAPTPAPPVGAREAPGTGTAHRERPHASAARAAAGRHPVRVVQRSSVKTQIRCPRRGNGGGGCRPCRPPRVLLAPPPRAERDVLGAHVGVLPAQDVWLHEELQRTHNVCSLLRRTKPGSRIKSRRKMLTREMPNGRAFSG